MEEKENIKSELEEIQTARDNIKAALQNEGETVTNDIRTYANAIPNVNKVKTVNGVEADTNKNVQIDASNINVDETAETKQTVKAKLEALGIEIQNIAVPEYSIKESTTTAGYSKTYSLTKDGAEVGVKVNIPKDLVINKGTVKVVATAGTPYENAVVGDKYLDIELNDPTKDHIYIPVKELVDVYTAGDGIEIDANNVIKSKNSNLINGTGRSSIMSKGAVKASQSNSIALGASTVSDGVNAIAIGTESQAHGTDGVAVGKYVIANTNQVVIGKYNKEDTNGDYTLIIGNGFGNQPVNAMTINRNNQVWFAGNVKVGGTGQDDTNAKQLATQEYVNNSIVTYTAGNGIEIGEGNVVNAYTDIKCFDSNDTNLSNDLFELFTTNINENADAGLVLIFYIDGYKFIIHGNEFNTVNISYCNIVSNIRFDNRTYLTISSEYITGNSNDLIVSYIDPIETILNVSGITSTNRYVELPYTSTNIDVYLNGEKLICKKSDSSTETTELKNSCSCYTYNNSGTTKLYFTSDYVIESTDKLVVRQYGVSENYVKG